jgi:hypothetical protein
VFSHHFTSNQECTNHVGERLKQSKSTRRARCFGVREEITHRIHCVHCIGKRLIQYCIRDSLFIASLLLQASFLTGRRAVDHAYNSNYITRCICYITHYANNYIALCYFLFVKCFLGRKISRNYLNFFYLAFNR